MFHRHKFEIIKIVRDFLPDLHWGVFGGEKITEVYKVCSICKKTKIETIDGHWNLEDLVN